MENQLRKANYFFNRSVFDIITHINFKYYHIKHGGEKKFCFIIRKLTIKLAKKNKNKKSHFENKYSPCQSSIK